MAQSVKLGIHDWTKETTGVGAAAMQAEGSHAEKGSDYLRSLNHKMSLPKLLDFIFQTFESFERFKMLVFQQLEVVAKTYFERIVLNRKKEAKSRD